MSTKILYQAVTPVLPVFQKAQDYVAPQIRKATDTFFQFKTTAQQPHVVAGMAGGVVSYLMAVPARIFSNFTGRIVQYGATLMGGVGTAKAVKNFDFLNGFVTKLLQ